MAGNEASSVTRGPVPGFYTLTDDNGSTSMIEIKAQTPAELEKQAQEAKLNPKEAPPAPEVKKDDSWQLSTSGGLKTGWGEYFRAGVRHATIEGQGFGVTGEFKLKFGPLSAAFSSTYSPNSGHKGPANYREGQAEPLKLTDTRSSNLYHSIEIGGDIKLSDQAKLTPALFVAQERTDVLGMNTDQNGVVELERFLAGKLKLTTNLLEKNETPWGFTGIDLETSHRFSFYWDRMAVDVTDAETMMTNRFPRNSDRIHNDTLLTLTATHPFADGEVALALWAGYRHELHIADQPADKPTKEKPNRVNAGDGSGDGVLLGGSVTFKKTIVGPLKATAMVGYNYTIPGVLLESGNGTNDFGITTRGGGGQLKTAVGLGW